MNQKEANELIDEAYLEATAGMPLGMPPEKRPIRDAREDAKGEVKRTLPESHMSRGSRR